MTYGKKDVLKDFGKLIGKKTPVLESFLIKLQAFIKKRLQHKCFP